MRASSDLKKLAFLGGFGFLPLWAAVVAMYLGSIQPHASSQYWTVAPWLAIAAVPYCGITLGIAFATLVVHKRTAGDESRKFKLSVLTFFSLCAAAVIAAALLWMEHKSQERDLKNEDIKAMEFVKNQKAAALAVGGDFRVSIVSTKISQGIPIQYDISVSGKKQMYAIVNASHASGSTNFSLACLTPLYIGQRDPSKDPCNQ
jgi:hypothetical protein